MTRNQIELNALLERRRAAMASEAIRTAELGETMRSNRVREQQATLSLDETSRANMARESQAMAELEQAKVRDIETGRANRAKESLQYGELGIKQGQLSETQRANLARERLQSDTLSETQRANLERERLQSEAQSETKRHNIVQEVENPIGQFIRALPGLLKDGGGFVNVKTTVSPSTPVNVSTGGAPDVNVYNVSQKSTEPKGVDRNVQTSSKETQFGWPLGLQVRIKESSGSSRPTGFRRGNGAGFSQ